MEYDPNEYVSDFWDSFNEEEKAELMFEGFENYIHTVIYVDFKNKKVLRKELVK